MFPLRWFSLSRRSSRVPFRSPAAHQRYRPWLELLESREAPANQELIPKRAVLIVEPDDFAGRAGPRPEPRCLDFHQCDQAVDFRLLGRQFR